MKPADSFILVVDDVISNLKVLGSILQSQGYNVSFATSGQQALDRVMVAQPDLILLDLMMPDVDGLEVCNRLKQDSQMAQIPVIFLTASHEQKHLLQAFSQGAVDYITKPFNAPELLARVKTHLELKYLQDLNQKQLQQERLIRHIVQATLESLELQTLLTTAAEGIRSYFQADRVLIYQCTEPGQRDQPIQPGRIVAESLVEGYDSLLGLSLEDCSWIHSPEAGEVFSKQVKVYDDREVSTIVSPQHQAALSQWQVKAEMVSPIFQRLEQWGAIIIHRCQNTMPWSPEEIQVVQSLVEQLEVAIQQASLYQQLKLLNQELRYLAKVDGLTGLANRRSFDEYLLEVWQPLINAAEPLSLVLCDIDYFKAYNDCYGHPQGDVCLRQVAGAIAQATHRPTDLAARYGGEEFALILPYTPLDGAQQVVQRLQTQMEILAIPHRDSQLGAFLTLSLGLVTLVPTPDLDPSEVVLLADRALYQAKAGGRNQVQVVTSEMLPPEALVALES